MQKSIKKVTQISKFEKYINRSDLIVISYMYLWNSDFNRAGESLEKLPYLYC